ncbi:hypothetical protein GCM10018785_24390 [Streptomyces longispororuber]|uniref:Uncharacterized protein n=1 Tax=Streptomyces longispororuber TaxID=68230 RepID=A0A918ZIZ4_9ACTN|nr:hypothetical protein GCM10018785_24390 [Streptomyces longispororuber]
MPGARLSRPGAGVAGDVAVLIGVASVLALSAVRAQEPERVPGFGTAGAAGAGPAGRCSMRIIEYPPGTQELHGAEGPRGVGVSSDRVPTRTLAVEL